MPRFDGTGPIGQGPLTGRGMGNCTSNAIMPRFRMGFGRGFFRGRGFAWTPRMPAWQIQQPEITESEEKQYLEEELEVLKEEMKEIEKRLKEIKS
jgi:hypothetical protein